MASSELLAFGNLRHSIISDFNSMDETEEYIDNIETIYHFQKRTIIDLRNRINQLNFQIEKSKTDRVR